MFIGFDWVCSEKQDNNYIHMKSKILTLILALFITFNINAQDSLFVKVPKQYSFEFGYRNLFGQSNFVNNATHGYGALFDYAWQLSGFKGKKPSRLSPYLWAILFCFPTMALPNKSTC